MAKLQYWRHLCIPLLFTGLLFTSSLVSCLIDSLVCNDDYGDDDGIIVSPGSPTCADVDRQALLIFKASISSDPNKALADWGLRRNCCDWSGVTCDGGSGRVVRLKLPDQNLKGHLAPELGSLSHLQALILYNNGLTGSIPSSLGNLSNLSRLCLGSSSLSGQIPESFGHGLKNLQLLDISDSSLSGSLPASMGGMSSLGRLFLSKNKISGAVPPSFGLLSRLYDATLANNEIDSLPEAFCSQLSTLIYLYLENNKLTSLPANLTNCSSLQYLSLQGNPIRNANAVAGIVTAPMIAEIDLSRCNLIGGFPSWVERLPHYNNPSGPQFDDELWPSIDLSNNQLTGPIPAAAIAALPSYILSVVLNNNRFTGRIPATFANINGLWGLLLQDNQLTGTIPAAFSKLTALTSFNVSNNHLSGSIPQVSPFTTFATSAYRPGNPGLCGSPLPRCIN